MEAITLLVSLILSLLIALWLYVHTQFGVVQKGVIGFFHPFADGGGGGERVLWCAVQALQSHYPNYEIAIYVREGVNAEQLVKDSSSRFNVKIDQHPIRVIPLKKAERLLPEHYPRLTMARQALASVLVAADGLRKLVPEVFVDTTGWAFPYPLAASLGSRVACYVHYPTVSSDMLESVRSRQNAVHNASGIARSAWKSQAKVLYYRFVAAVYGWCGRRATIAMANSSWTLGHVREIWRTQRPLHLVFPPVDTSSLTQLDVRSRRLSSAGDASAPSIVSINQFRPEKNHKIQIEAFALAKRKAAVNAVVQKAVLRLVGGSRNAEDAARVADLKLLASSLGVADSVEWYVNAPYAELRRLLSEASAGIHSMHNEHFGIGVVEYMAGGAIAIAHNSGGPKSDIITPVGVGVKGFLAKTAEEYADALITVLTMDDGEWMRVAAAGQEDSKRFSTEKFQEAFLEAMAQVLK